jgi:hypothetical protein
VGLARWYVSDYRAAFAQVGWLCWWPNLMRRPLLRDGTWF